MFPKMKNNNLNSIYYCTVDQGYSFLLLTISMNLYSLHMAVLAITYEELIRSLPL